MKGEKLARLISPTRTVSLILSDIIRDPLVLIARGPTVCAGLEFIARDDKEVGEV